MADCCCIVTWGRQTFSWPWEAHVMVGSFQPTCEARFFNRSGQIVCGFLHLAILPQRVRAALAATGVNILSYELIRSDEGTMPILMPMSEITGKLLPQLAAHLL